MFRTALIGALLLTAVICPARGICSPASPPDASNPVENTVFAAEKTAEKAAAPEGRPGAAPGNGLISDAGTAGEIANDQPMSSRELGDASGGFSGSNNTISNGSNNTTNTTVSIGAVTDQTLEATNTGNSLAAAGPITNGSVTIGTSAFSGFNGIGNFVMNTGNQNNVQSSLNVTIVNPPASH